MCMAFIGVNQLKLSDKTFDFIRTMAVILIQSMKNQSFLLEVRVRSAPNLGLAILCFPSNHCYSDVYDLHRCQTNKNQS